VAGPATQEENPLVWDTRRAKLGLFDGANLENDAIGPLGMVLAAAVVVEDGPAGVSAACPPSGPRSIRWSARRFSAACCPLLPEMVKEAFKPESTRWPLHPLPHDFETIDHWVKRIASAYGVTCHVFCRNVLGFDDPAKHTFKPLTPISHAMAPIRPTTIRMADFMAHPLPSRLSTMELCLSLEPTRPRLRPSQT
jgi:hypothetical protein